MHIESCLFMAVTATVQSNRLIRHLYMLRLRQMPKIFDNSQLTSSKFIHPKPNNRFAGAYEMKKEARKGKQRLATFKAGLMGFWPR